MAEKGMRCGLCHSIDRYAKANNKCMKDYEFNEKSESEFNEYFMKRFNCKSNEG